MVMRRKSTHIRLEEILFATVLNLNAIRFFLNITESSAALYLLFALSIGIAFFKEKKVFARKDTIFVLPLMIGVAAYGTASILWLKNGAYFEVIKLIISFLLFLYARAFSIKKTKRILIYSVAINLVYSLMIFMFPNRLMKYYYSGETNYLNMTLTLGFAMTVAFSYALCYAFSTNQKKKAVLWLFIGALIMLACFRFTARGAILLPVVCIAMLLLIIGGKRKTRFIVMTNIFIVIALLGIRYFLLHVGGYAASRMTNLFTNVGEEDRLFLWKSAINSIISQKWYLLGGGVNAFKYTEIGFYPHNIILQVIGEYGFIGFLLLFYLVYGVTNHFFSATKRLDKRSITLEDSITVYVIFTGALYYFLTFNKSFSLYDSYALFLTFGLSIGASKSLLKQNKNGLYVIQQALIASN